MFFRAVPVLFVFPQMAHAHGGQQGFILLLPTDYYIAAGTASVVASIIIVSLLPASALAKGVAKLPYRRSAEPSGPSYISSLISTILFILLIAVGMIGPNDPQNNLLPLVFWNVWWIACFVLQGTVMNVWSWTNPWYGLHKCLDFHITPIIRIPARFGTWPAITLFVGFQSFLMADPAPSDPRHLANIAFGYWLFTLLGMMFCGREKWLAQVEFISVLFDLLATLRLRRLPPCELRNEETASSIESRPLPLSSAVFCLSILASGSFDGLHETFWWLGQIGINPLEFPGRSAVFWHSLIGLYLANLTLIIAFGLSVWFGLSLIKRSGTGDKISFEEAFRTFSIAILPIAVGYHFAHYFVTFLVQIQYVVSTFSDPLARGWNLFGLGSFRVTTGFLNVSGTVKTIWMIQAGAVVLSHICAVLMTHYLAERMTHSRREALQLQTGISILMIFYTIFGLWLLASPRGV